LVSLIKDGLQPGCKWKVLTKHPSLSTDLLAAGQYPWGNPLKTKRCIDQSGI